MATTLGGTTLADPLYDHDGYGLEHIDVGAAHEMADGSTVYDYVGTRYRFPLKWQHITAAEALVIRTRALEKGSQTFSPPDATTTYTVRVIPNTYKQTYVEDGGGTERYNCELTLETVAVV